MSNSSEPPFNALRNELLQALGSDMTQTELAHTVYVTPAAANYWFTGQHRPRPAILGALAAILGRSPYDLANLAGYEDPATLDRIMQAYNDRLQLLNRKAEPR
jgi:transcriptional regulator with XRE-family HTH domain